MAIDVSLEVLCGQLIVVGFAGTALEPALARALERGERGGVILFRRNVPTIGVAHQLCRAIARATPSGLPPWVGIDEEGGRVRRMPAPTTTLPPMRELAARRDEALLAEAGDVVGGELAAVGINIDFAPVLDVDTNPQNPVIGDRAFATTPGEAARYAIAFYRGLSRHVLGCGKHFPGHGDTDVDSHLALPAVRHARARLDAIELAPFAAAARSGIDALMTAHVVATALDPDRPATMSRAICVDLLRGGLGFRGVLFSDDLEMKAVAATMSAGEAAVAAVDAGCDVLLVCSDEGAQADAHAALVREARRHASFRARCEEAFARGLEARERRPPAPAPSEQALAHAFQTERARALAARLSEAAA